MRLVTRSDLDGLACALILAEHEPIDDVLLISAQDITDKRVEITSDDIVANLPYHPACGAWFDHRLLTESNERPPPDFDGLYREAPSAAQLVWEHYGEEKRFSHLVQETNKLDSAQLDEDDVLQPRGHILLGFTLDPRTGFGDEHSYFMHCLDLVRERPIDEALVDPQVRRRIFKMFEDNENFCWYVASCSTLVGNVVYTDFRRIEELPVGNRFLVYTLFGEANVSVLAQWGRQKDAVILKVGHSIFNRTCRTSVGELLSRYGGGGHRGAGATLLPVMEADSKIFQIINTLQHQG